MLTFFATPTTPLLPFEILISLMFWLSVECHIQRERFVWDAAHSSEQLFIASWTLLFCSMDLRTLGIKILTRKACWRELKSAAIASKSLLMREIFSETSLVDLMKATSSFTLCNADVVTPITPRYRYFRRPRTHPWRVKSTTFQASASLSLRYWRCWVLLLLKLQCLRD